MNNEFRKRSIILCGFFCGCNTIEEVIEYALLQEEWFSSLFEESMPSPSYGAIWWFLVKTPPETLKDCFQKWFSKILDSLRDQLLTIDGNRLRGANFMGHITHVVE
ncbi:MAG: transposase family protein [Chlamydiales bacterium]|jgi:hypothetical protein|nr:transposase family protein [Chlamydiales bacterium]